MGRSWGLGTLVTGGLVSLPASFPGSAFATVSVAEATISELT